MKLTHTCAKAGVILVLGVTAMTDAHAQRSPWWERQKAAQAQPSAIPATTTSSARSSAGSSETPTPRPAPVLHQNDAYIAESADAGPSYTYIEAGANRLDEDMSGFDQSGTGGYVRASAAVTDSLYLLGGYDRAAESWSASNQSLKITIDQAEIGFGSRLPLSTQSDFISELSLVRLGAKVDYRDHAIPQNDLRASDHLLAGKFMVGIRGQVVPRLELWAKGGYLHVDDSWLIESSIVGNIGAQFRIGQMWGLLAEAEFYEDIRFYRLGMRASF